MTDDEKELLKTGAEAAMKPFASLIERLFGGPVDQIGGMWEDSLRTRRQLRQIELFRKLKTSIEEASIEPHPIPDKVWLPALQAALMEDDDNLQTMWANMLASAAVPEQEALPYAAFIEALRQISAAEAKFLDMLYEEIEERLQAFERLSEKERTIEKSRQLMNIGDAPTLRDGYCSANTLLLEESDSNRFTSDLAIENLQRLGIIEGPREGQTRRRLTKFGWALGVLCRHPEQTLRNRAG